MLRKNVKQLINSFKPTAISQVSSSPNHVCKLHSKYWRECMKPNQNRRSTSKIKGKKISMYWLWEQTVQLEQKVKFHAPGNTQIYPNDMNCRHKNSNITVTSFTSNLLSSSIALTITNCMKNAMDRSTATSPSCESSFDSVHSNTTFRESSATKQIQ